MVVIEYNQKFPPPYEWVMPYNPKHIWQRQSDLHGASLEALTKLGTKKGYRLVGTCMAGVNAFFVKNELAKDLFPVPATAKNLYHPTYEKSYVSSGHKARKYIGN